VTGIVQPVPLACIGEPCVLDAPPFVTTEEDIGIPKGSFYVRYGEFSSTGFFEIKMVMRGTRWTFQTDMEEFEGTVTNAAVDIKTTPPTHYVKLRISSQQTMWFTISKAAEYNRQSPSDKELAMGYQKHLQAPPAPQPPQRKKAKAQPKQAPTQGTAKPPKSIHTEVELPSNWIAMVNSGDHNDVPKIKQILEATGLMQERLSTTKWTLESRASSVRKKVVSSRQ